MSLQVKDVHFTPSFSLWHKDARWTTHQDRILYGITLAAQGIFDQREQVLEGSRKIRWWSILDVDCPICGAGKDVHCGESEDDELQNHP